jgi:hypothetical protein
MWGTGGVVVHRFFVPPPRLLPTLPAAQPLCKQLGDAGAYLRRGSGSWAQDLSTQIPSMLAPANI